MLITISQSDVIKVASVVQPLDYFINWLIVAAWH